MGRTTIPRISSTLVTRSLRSNKGPLQHSLYRLTHLCYTKVVDQEEEQLVVVTETREGSSDNLESLFKNMKNRISEENGITPSVIVVVKPKTIPKTTSGKISRSAVKQQYLQHELEVIASVNYKPEEVNEQDIRSIFWNCVVSSV